jgi:hypothetical protein
VQCIFPASLDSSVFTALTDPTSPVLGLGKAGILGARVKLSLLGRLEVAF